MRRWEGSTATPVTPHTGLGPPGTVMVKVSPRVLPTSRSPSKAPRDLSHSIRALNRSARGPAVSSANASSSSSSHSPHSESLIGRMAGLGSVFIRLTLWPGKPDRPPNIPV